MKMSYNLFLDDDSSRIPHKLTWVELPLVEWDIVRNYDEFVNHIKKHGMPLRISFDHDLDETAYQEFHRANNSDKILNYDNIKEKTGYHAAKWLVELCVNTKVPIPEYYIHTLNHIGRLNIISILENAKKVLTNP